MFQKDNALSICPGQVYIKFALPLGECDRLYSTDSPHSILKNRVLLPPKLLITNFLDFFEILCFMSVNSYTYEISYFIQSIVYSKIIQILIILFYNNNVDTNIDRHIIRHYLGC